MPSIGRRLGFIAAGQMAAALAKGFVASGAASAEGICAADPSQSACEAFAAASGGRIVADNRQVVEKSDVVFLATKPQHAGDAMESIRASLTPDHLVVSIVAGLPLSRLAQALDDRPRLARVMPNTPCLIGAGASAWCRGPKATDEDAQIIQSLLSAVGQAHEVPETLMDAVTGLSGSGPAFAFVIIEALADAGVRMGLPRSTAQALAAQTLAGAARMVLETGEHPTALKDRVASPGGTTICGLQALEEFGVRAGLMAAVQAATERSRELRDE